VAPVDIEQKHSLFVSLAIGSRRIIMTTIHILSQITRIKRNNLIVQVEKTTKQTNKQTKM